MPGTGKCALYVGAFFLRRRSELRRLVVVVVVVVVVVLLLLVRLVVLGRLRRRGEVEEDLLGESNSGGC